MKYCTVTAINKKKTTKMLINILFFSCIGIQCVSDVMYKFQSLATFVLEARQSNLIKPDIRKGILEFFASMTSFEEDDVTDFF